jgi:hypothetical protein
LLASARFALAPPEPVVQAARPYTPSASDLGARGYASLFVRAYLSWGAVEPQARTRLLSAFVGGSVEPGAGLRPAPSGSQHVEWVEVVQERVLGTREHVYTVAAQTDAAGLVYVTVGIVRSSDGSLALAGYPAFVGAPASTPAPTLARLAEVGDLALTRVVERALRNYLAASREELAADLTSTARVSLPDLALTLQSVQRLDWSPDRRSVVAVVAAQDARGTQYTLAYELDVVRAAGRWEISAVQMDPNT